MRARAPDLSWGPGGVRSHAALVPTRGSGTRPHETMSEDPAVVIGISRDVLTVAALLCLQSCRSVTKYWGGTAPWGPTLIIKANRASLMSCLLLNPHSGRVCQNSHISADLQASVVYRVFDSVARARISGGKQRRR